MLPGGHALEPLPLLAGQASLRRTLGFASCGPGQNIPIFEIKGWQVCCTYLPELIQGGTLRYVQ